VPRPSLTAVALNDLANLYADLERFSESRQLMEESLNIKELYAPAATIELGIGYTNLGTILLDLGDLDAAEVSLRRSISILSQQDSSGLLPKATALNNLARLQQRQGNWQQAEVSLKQAQAIRQKRLPAHHPELTLGWNDLGMLALSRGHMQDARFNLERAYAETQSRYGKDHPLTAIQIANLGHLARVKGHLQEARSRYGQAQALLEKKLGPGHPDSLRTLADLLVIRHQLGESTALLKPLKDLMQRRNQLLISEAGRLPIRDRLMLLNRRDPSWYLADALARKNPEAAQLALALRLSSQGVLQELHRNQLILAGESAPLAETLVEIRAINTRLARQPSEITDNKDLLRRRSVLEAKLPSELLKRTDHWIDPSQIVKVLPVRTALIEFRRYLDPTTIRTETDSKLPWRYQAYVLHQTGQLQLVDLGSASEIEPLIREAYRATSERLADASQLWKPVFNRLILPLKAATAGTSEIFISPDAGLHQVPFQALLPLSRIRLLTTGRDLLRLNSPTTAAVFSSSVVAGNPQLSNSLPAAGIELQKIGIQLGVTPIEGENFTTNALQAVHKPRILHIATHGFWDSVPPGQTPRGSLEKDAMLRSGLLVTPMREPGGQSNRSERFSAVEFLGLDLNGTELVTLAACSTGLGDLHDSEGIYGLQRSISVAGTRSLLTSLWPVDDAATSDWMQRYYSHLKSGIGRADALASVNTEFRNHPNPAWRDPYYWAGWQLVGDWRPIQGL
jgi:CHAT domain-containing protein